MAKSTIISPFYGSIEIKQSDDFGLSKLKRENAYSIDQTMTLKHKGIRSRRTRNSKFNQPSQLSILDLLDDEK